MSQTLESRLDKLNHALLKILGISKTNLLSLHVGYKAEQYFTTASLHDDGTRSLTTSVDDGKIFAGASLFKMFTAYGLTLIVEGNTKIDTPRNKYSKLKNTWDRTFTVLFNEISDGIKIGRLKGDPSLKELVTHTKGVCDLNHILVAPDGRPLSSKVDFLNILPQYTEDTHRHTRRGSSWCEYSNANYILLALLIEAASGTTLSDFLKNEVFQPLGLHRTYTTLDELNKVPRDKRAYPHLVASDGHCVALDFATIPYLADTVEIAATGGYTCAGDIGIFLNAITKKFRTDKPFAEAIFRGTGFVDDDEENGYTKFGLRTSLSCKLPGSHSVNRLIPESSKLWDYIMNEPSHDRPVRAYYMAGSLTGWGSTVYFLPNHCFVIVLTDSCGALDASDIIAKLYLSELLDLTPSRIGDPNFSQQFRGKPAARWAHYVNIAQQIYNENTEIWRKMEEYDRVNDTPYANSPEACGKYICRASNQTLDVVERNGFLRVTLHGASKSSGLMRFVRVGQNYRICPLDTPLAIDRFGDWRNLEFEFREENGIVVSLLRRGWNLDNRFVREAT